MDFVLKVYDFIKTPIGKIVLIVLVIVLLLIVAHSMIIKVTNEIDVLKINLSR